jgi:hypothetical protein
VCACAYNLYAYTSTFISHLFIRRADAIGAEALAHTSHNLTVVPSALLIRFCGTVETRVRQTHTDTRDDVAGYRVERFKVFFIFFARRGKQNPKRKKEEKKAVARAACRAITRS